MLVLIVDKPLEEMKLELLQEKNSLEKEKLVSKVLNSRLKLVNRKIKLLSNYESMSNKKSRYSQILRLLREEQPEQYDIECKELCRGVKGISYQTKLRKFRVQRTINKKKFYGGSFESFDDAVYSLELLLNAFETHGRN